MDGPAWEKDALEFPRLAAYAQREVRAGRAARRARRAAGPVVRAVRRRRADRPCSRHRPGSKRQRRPRLDRRRGRRASRMGSPTTGVARPRGAREEKPARKSARGGGRKTKRRCSGSSVRRRKHGQPERREQKLQADLKKLREQMNRRSFIEATVLVTQILREFPGNAEAMQLKGLIDRGVSSLEELKILESESLKRKRAPMQPPGRARGPAKTIPRSHLLPQPRRRRRASAACAWSCSSPALPGTSGKSIRRIRSAR